jgi:hypothetical protein
MNTLPEANKSWSPETQAFYNDIKTEMERVCKTYDIPIRMLRNSIINSFEDENIRLRNYASTKEDKKPAGIVRCWLSSLFGNN